MAEWLKTLSQIYMLSSINQKSLWYGKMENLCGVLLDE